MKLDKVGYNKPGMWVELDNGQRVWMTIVGNDKFNAEAVKGFIKKGYKQGQEIKLDYYQDDKGQYMVKSVITGNYQPQTKTENVQEPVKPQPSAPVQTQSPKTYNSVATGRNDSIERQTVIKAVAETLKAIPSVTPDNVVQLIDTIYKAYITKMN